jgi:hypothetical protein
MYHSSRKQLWQDLSELGEEVMKKQRSAAAKAASVSGTQSEAPRAGEDVKAWAAGTKLTLLERLQQRIRDGLGEAQAVFGKNRFDEQQAEAKEAATEAVGLLCDRIRSGEA